MSPYDKPSSYSTIHESSKRIISEPTHLIEDPHVSNIINIIILQYVIITFNTYTQVPLSPYDKPSSYSTIHESSKRIISEPTHLIEDPHVSNIINIIILQYVIITFNTYTQVPLSPYDKPSSYSTIHESSKRIISEPTHLIKDPDEGDILIYYNMTL